MDNNNIIWIFNIETQEWELPDFIKNKIDKREKQDIIIEEHGKDLRKLKDSNE